MTVSKLPMKPKNTSVYDFFENSREFSWGFRGLPLGEGVATNEVGAQGEASPS